MIKNRRRGPLTHRRINSFARMDLPPLPDSARWTSEHGKIKRVWWIILAVAAVHLTLLWALRDVPLYQRPGVVSPPPVLANFYSEIVPEIRENGRTVQPAEQRFTVSTKWVEASPAVPLTPPPAPLAGVTPTLPPLADQAGPNRGETTGASPAASGPPALISVFNLSASAQSVVYLLDASGSMWEPIDLRAASGPTRYETARDEIIRSVRSLPSQIAFNIVIFADRPLSLSPTLLMAAPPGKKLALEFLQRMPDLRGETDFVSGLRLALRLEPESVFILTDGLVNLPLWKVLEQVRDLQRDHPVPARLYAIGLAPLGEEDGDQLLRSLTRANGGIFQPFHSWRTARVP